MTVAGLCQAAVCYSDNTAANLLFPVVGGPAGLTRYLRSLGDRITNLNRIEPFLNEARPGDVRDTTSPSAMVHDLQKLLLHKALSAESRALLTKWLVGCTTGSARLRAGLPRGWRVGDKTGTGKRGTSNDVAIAWPPGRKPLLIAAYLTESTATASARDAALADVGRIIQAEMANASQSAGSNLQLPWTRA
jgi:beta-lactamase class A